MSMIQFQAMSSIDCLSWLSLQTIPVSRLPLSLCVLCVCLSWYPWPHPLLSPVRSRCVWNAAISQDGRLPNSTGLAGLRLLQPHHQPAHETVWAGQRPHAQHRSEEHTTEAGRERVWERECQMLNPILMMITLWENNVFTLNAVENVNASCCFQPFTKTFQTNRLSFSLRSFFPICFVELTKGLHNNLRYSLKPASHFVVESISV